jgi:hypothetical protein
VTAVHTTVHTEVHTAVHSRVYTVVQGVGMKRLAVAVVAVVGLGTTLAAQGTADTKAIVSSYLAIQDQLASDKFDKVKAPAQEIAAQASKLGESGTAMVTAARAVEEAADLEAVRKAFGPLSDAVIAATKGQLGDAKVAFCPMAKASWLQKEGTIRNPYYGASMLTCGEFKKP